MDVSEKKSIRNRVSEILHTISSDFASDLYIVFRSGSPHLVTNRSRLSSDILICKIVPGSLPYWSGGLGIEKITSRLCRELEHYRDIIFRRAQKEAPCQTFDAVYRTYKRLLSTPI